MQSNPLGLEISEEAAEKLEVVCGCCDRKIRIRSLGEHVRREHAQSPITNTNDFCHQIERL
jgi:hypothetical protein